MNVGYLTWFEPFDLPVLQTQVNEVLMAAKSRLAPGDTIKHLSFQTRRRYPKIVNHPAVATMAAAGVDMDIVARQGIGRPSFIPRWYTLPMVYAQCLPRVRRFIKTNDIHVLHCRGYFPTLVGLAAARGKIPVIFDPRSPFPETHVVSGDWTESSASFRMWKKLEARLCQRSSAVVAIATPQLDELAEAAPDATYEVIPNNVDTERFQPDPAARRDVRRESGINEDAIVIGFVGNVGPHWNNPETYANLMARLEDAAPGRFHFLAVTSNPAAIDEAFNGHLPPGSWTAVSAPNEGVPRYLAAADFGLNIMANRDVRMSIKTSEYLAMGLPVITNKQLLGAADMVRRHQLGVVIDDLNDVDAASLAAELSQQAGSQAGSKRARDFAVKHLSTSEVGAAYARLYQALAPGR